MAAQHPRLDAAPTVTNATMTSLGSATYPVRTLPWARGLQLKGADLRERFEILRPLGRGGAGMVHEVFDRQRGARVALKELAHVDARMIAAFKHEFRTLAGITHPNLVQLYEFLSDGAVWFFTMELVLGCDFRAHVRPQTPAGEALDHARLASAFVQLSEGLAVLHAAGKVHRDLKPSNVLVDGNGRIVVVDFGLVTDARDRAGEDDDDGINGTPAYMAPEQIAGEPVGPPADLYALGVMLFVALTGALPFASADVLADKLLKEAPGPVTLNTSVDPELDALCRGLLAREPHARPTLDDVRRTFGSVGTAVARIARASSPPSALVGRESAMATLHAALRRAREGAASIVAVEGTSGFGKTALVHAFLEQAGRGGAIILASRCYERESLPHKTLDGVAEALTRYLERRPEVQSAVVPGQAWALARLISTVERLPAVAAQMGSNAMVTDPHQVRELASSSLAEMLERLSARQPVVVFVDDLQWGDSSGTSLLLDVFGRLPTTRVLGVFAYRGENVATTPWLAGLGEAIAALPAPVALDQIAVGPLTREQGRAVASATLGPGLGEDDELVLRVVDESQGNPFFLGELVRHARASGGAPGTMRLASVIRARLGRLSADAQNLLEVVATAGRPMPPALAFRAAAIPPEDAMRALAALRAAALLRSSDAGSESLLECAHDRVRESIVETLEQGRARVLHARLAAELAQGPAPDPEELALHHAAAGNVMEAREYGVLAARRAKGALAFDRAAALYRTALEALDPGDPRGGTLRLELADALANAGRGG